jgi:hypothetical protein
MGRREMARVKSYAPWLVEETDVNPAESGLFSRDLQIHNQPQRHYGLAVLGTFDHSLTLGMIAIRCERHKGQMYPLTLALVDAPPPEARTPTMDLSLLKRNPVRHEDAADVGGD